MISHYHDYFWKMGKPIGKINVDPFQSPLSYKIVPDPYHRRYSIEKYSFGRFDKTVYDSYLLDFRHLKSIDQMAWQKENLGDTEGNLLRNQDDRVVLKETYFFEQNLCRSCKIFSIHGIFIATSRMYYEILQDPFNGVIFFDLENRPVMKKIYQVDEDSGTFTELLSEEWNMQNNSTLV